ncbi:D-alanyl-D-alanine carboxypeptidase [Streptomyces sp. WAC07149]|uniref:D-alanyl-D-alanine carboxypeptidase n=1 Tax=Streptomyces sp. WAC07149 TaxID=2487425 RepID=UPI0021AFBE5B|nr:serine hydrolase [Streptomyces sp. WAC07149]
MKAETVSNGARAGRNPQEGEPGPDGALADAPAGREPKDTAPEPETDALAGREPQSTAPDPQTNTPTDALTGHEPKDTAPEPETDTPTRTLTKRETTTPEADADALAGHEPKDTAPEPETDTPTRTLTKRETTTPEPDGPAGPADPRVRDHAGREPKSTAPKPESGTGRGSADALVQRGATDAEPEPADDTPDGREPAGTPEGRAAADAAPAGRGSAADTAAQREVDARPRADAPREAAGGGDAAEREPVRAPDRREQTAAGEGTGTVPEPEGGTAARREPARPSAGSGPDAEADTATRPGKKAGEASAQAGKDRPRPSWAKGDAPKGDDPADGTVPARPESPRPSRAEDRPRPSWAKAEDGEGSPKGKGTPAPRLRPGMPSPKEEAAAAGAGQGRPSGGVRPDGAPTDREGAAAQPHDPERTSEFVALKDPDAVRPPKPKTQPQPQPAQRPAPVVLEPTREAPLPPLELLAELTNTAPPPETPRRTLTRRVKVWTPIVLLLGGVVAGAQMLRPLPAPTFVTDRTSHTIEGSTTIPWPAKGQAAVRFPGSGAISTFGEQKPVPTASVGKVMTAYVILKNHPLRKDEPGPGIEIDAKAVAEGKSEDESRIKDLTLGQKFSEQDMLKMMMIPSANNIARQLARWDSGNDEAAFVAKMNAAAKELGMRDTTYTDPSGLDAGTVSTAVDQLKLAEAVMREEAFREIVQLASSPVTGRTQAVDNNNTLLSVRGLGAVGIKTGSSTPAGGTLMWAADKKVGGESPLILGVMMEQRVDGPDPNAAKSLELVLNNSRKIIEAVRKALAPATVIRKGQPVGHVSDGLGGSTPLVATKDLTVIGVPGQQLRLSLGAGAKPLPHEAKAGTEVGVLTVGEGLGAKTVPVAVGTDLVGPSFGARVTRLS